MSPDSLLAGGVWGRDYVCTVTDYACDRRVTKGLPQIFPLYVGAKSVPINQVLIVLESDTKSERERLSFTQGKVKLSLAYVHHCVLCLVVWHQYNELHTPVHLNLLAFSQSVNPLH